MKLPSLPLRFLGRNADAVLLGGFLVVAAILFAFLKLASEVSEGDTAAFDRWLLQALRSPADPGVPIGPYWLKNAMVDVTALGGTTVLTAFTVIAVGYLAAARKIATAGFLAGAVIGGALMGKLLKLLFARDRPDLVLHLVTVDSASFPSGHALNSAVVYLTVGALLARTESKRSVRIYTIGVALCPHPRHRLLARLPRRPLAERRDRRLVRRGGLGDPLLAGRAGLAAKARDRAAAERRRGVTRLCQPVHQPSHATAGHVKVALSPGHG